MESYKRHTVDDAAGTRALMEWLEVVGRSGADPIGVATLDGTIALAQGGDVYVIEPALSGTSMDCGVLAAALMGGSPPRLITLKADETLVELTRTLDGFYPIEDFFPRLSACVTGSLTTCARIGNFPQPPDLGVEDAAHTARLLEPQYRYEVPPYYEGVALPLDRARAEWMLFGKEAAADWWVSYPDLWIRVLIRYTGDPTLTWILQQEQDPIGALARLFERPLEETQAALLWHVCGRAVDVMAGAYPNLVDALPDDLPAVADRWNRQLPSLWLGIATIMQEYQRDRMARTLYGRKLRGGSHPGEAGVHVILGTVQDILEVASVTFWNNRPGPSVMIKGVEGSTIDKLCRVIGVGPAAVGEREQWVEIVRQLAPLAAPLGIPSLDPTVVRPPDESPAPTEVQESEASTRSSSGRSGTSRTTKSRTRGGSTSSGTTRKRQKANPTKPKGSAAGRKRSPATAAKPSCGSSPAKSRAQSSKGRK